MYLDVGRRVSEGTRQNMFADSRGDQGGTRADCRHSWLTVKSPTTYSHGLAALATLVCTGSSTNANIARSCYADRVALCGKPTGQTRWSDLLPHFHLKAPVDSDVDLDLDGMCMIRIERLAFLD